MQKVFGFLKKSASLIALIALGIAGGCSFLYYAGTFPGSFLPGLSHFLIMMLFQCVIAGLFICILLKKDNLIKVFLPLVLAAWLFFYTVDYLGDAYMAQKYYEGIQIGVGVFAFFVGITLLGAMTLKVLGKVLKPLFGTLSNLVLLMSIPFFFILMILLIAMYAVLEYPWASYFNAFFTMALPIGIIFANLAYSSDDFGSIFAKKSKTKKEKTVKEVEEENEPAEEPEVVEDPVVEEPAEENIDPTVFDENAQEDK